MKTKCMELKEYVQDKRIVWMVISLIISAPVVSTGQTYEAEPEYTIAMSLNKEIVESGEDVQLTWRIIGTGNATLMSVHVVSDIINIKADKGWLVVNRITVNPSGEFHFETIDYIPFDQKKIADEVQHFIPPKILPLKSNQELEIIGNTFLLSGSEYASLGSHTINVNVIYASNDGTFSKHASLVYTVQGVQDKVLQILPLTAVLISIVSIGITGYQTWRLRQERKIEFRAWVNDAEPALIPMRVFNSAGESKKIEEWKNMSPEDKQKFGGTRIETAIRLKNFGKVPANAVKGRYKIVFDTEPKRGEILPIEFGYPFDLMPQAERLFVFDDHEATAYTSSGKVAYLIIDIGYTYPGSKEEKRYGFIAKLSRGSYLTIDSWDEKTFSSK